MKNENTIAIFALFPAAALTLIFLILRLAGLVCWSWWWIFSPLWISLVLIIVLMLFVYIYLVLRVSDIKKKEKLKKG